MPFYTEWTQLDTIRTREPHRLEAGVNSNIVHRHGSIADLHSGEIEYDPHYLDTVFYPAQNTTMGIDGVVAEADQRASFVNNERWLATPIARLPDPEEYDALLHITGGASHVHDFDPIYEWRLETQLALMDAFEAANPGATIEFFEWETNPFAVQPWGTHANRLVEVDLSLLLNTTFNRAGSATGTADTTVLDHAILAVPNTFLNPEDSWDYSWDPTLEKWGGFENPARGHTWPEVVSDMLLLGGPFPAGVNRFDIDDAVWDANAWPVARTAGFGDYQSLGLPLIIGPSFAAAPTVGVDDPLGFEEHIRYTTTAAIWFESDWTPPRYRIVYESAATRPALRLYPRDGDGRGLGGVRRLYPPPRGHRLVGGQP